MKHFHFIIILALLALTINTFALPETKIVASDVAETAYFGRSACIDGDYLITGASKADSGGATDAGAAYIFHRSGSNWIQQAKLFASDAEADDWFCYSH